jgi:two-component system cell cycle sensor histidine kinase/response regulator CckA
MKNNPIKILLIEDNPGDANLVKEMLAEAETLFELTHVDKLGKVLAVGRALSFDVILLDLSLPDAYGLDTVIKMRAAMPNIPIVVMSGLGDVELAIKALHEGAQDYLVKGQADSNLLIRSVRYAIERKQAEEALRRAHDELEIRVKERTAELVSANEALLAEIAERKKMQEALFRSEASLAEAQRIAHLGNWEWNISADQMHWSDEIYRIFGKTPEQFRATYETFLGCIHPDDRELVKEAVDSAMSGIPYNIDHRIVLPDGSVRFVNEQGRVTFNESGVPVRMLGTVQDITEKKEKEIRLIMTERLAALGQMASGVAHEINNPLATVAACAEGLMTRLRQGRFDRELFENYLQIIDEEVARCKAITTSMLSFVRKTSYEKRDVDINFLINKTLELVNFQGRLKDVEVKKKYDGMLIAHGSEGELRQVLLIIILNSLDAMEDRGALTIGTWAEDNRVCIEISDTGPGIPRELLQKIFDSFFTTKSEEGGLGLGLSIAHKIVKDHNGDILVASDGNGTTFRIVLPR